MRVTVVLAVAASLILGASPALAQRGPAASPGPPSRRPRGAPLARPRIGVVLSGGGARGLTHIGVLKVMEELRIPIDYIARPAWARSSAACTRRACRPRGWKELVTSLDWPSFFSDQPPRRELSVRGSARTRATRFRWRSASATSRCGSPPARSPGRTSRCCCTASPTRRRHRELRQPAHPVPRRRDEPGRRPGSRLRSGSAVRRDARQHVGARHLRAARHRRPDAGRRRARQEPSRRHREVDGRRGRHRDQHRHAADDARAAFVVRQRRRAVDQHPDRAERPRAARAARSVARHPDRARPRRSFGGRFRARARSSSRSARRLRAPPPMRCAATRCRPTRMPSTAIRCAVRRSPPKRSSRSSACAGPKSPTPRCSRRRSGVTPGAQLDLEQAQLDIATLYGRGDFERIDYRLVPDGARRGVEFVVTEKPWGPSYLLFGVGFTSDTQGENYFGLACGTSARGSTRWAGEWINDVELGTINMYSTELYQPLNLAQSVFVAPYASIAGVPENLFMPGRRRSPSTACSTSASASTSGSRSAAWGELRVGPQFAHQRARSRDRPAAVPDHQARRMGDRARSPASIRRTTRSFRATGCARPPRCFTGTQRQRDVDRSVTRGEIDLHQSLPIGERDALNIGVRLGASTVSNRRCSTTSISADSWKSRACGSASCRGSIYGRGTRRVPASDGQPARLRQHLLSRRLAGDRQRLAAAQRRSAAATPTRPAASSSPPTRPSAPSTSRGAIRTRGDSTWYLLPGKAIHERQLRMARTQPPRRLASVHADEGARDAAARADRARRRARGSTTSTAGATSTP